MPSKVVRAKRFFVDESGQVIVLSLGLAVVLFLCMAYAARAARDVALADASLKGAVALAAKAAASQQAKNAEPLLDPRRARRAFEEILADNLGLRRGSLEPEARSAWAEAPDYRLVVYNGERRGRVPAGVEYVFEDGALTDEELSGEGFPKRFTVGEGLEVELSRPGVVAAVRITSKELFGDSEPYERWAAAEVAPDGNGVVLLSRVRG